MRVIRTDVRGDSGIYLGNGLSFFLDCFLRCGLLGDHNVLCRTRQNLSDCNLQEPFGIQRTIPIEHAPKLGNRFYALKHLCGVLGSNVELEVKIKPFTWATLGIGLHILHTSNSEVFLVRPVLLIKTEHLIDHVLEVMKYFVHHFLLFHLRFGRIDPRCIPPEISVGLFLDVSSDLDVSCIKPRSIRKSVLSGGTIWYSSTRPPFAWRSAQGMFKRGQSGQALSVNQRISLHLEYLLEGFDKFGIASGRVQSLARLFQSGHRERILSVCVIEQLVLCVYFAQVLMHDGTIKTGSIILIEQSLIAIEYLYVLIISTYELILFLDVVQVVFALRIVRKLDHLIDELLVPILSPYLCPNLFGGHANDVKDVRSFLRINRIVGPKNILIRGKSLDLGATDHFSGNGHSRFSVLSQLPEHPPTFPLGYSELLLEQLYELIIHAPILYGFGNGRKLLGKFLKADSLLLFQVLLLIPAVMNHHSLLKEMIESKLDLRIKFGHLAVYQPAKKIAYY